MKIYLYPYEGLLKASKDVEVFDDALKKTCNDMLSLMYEATGVGLAAPQVGLNKRIIVIDPIHPDSGKDPKPQIFINPKIVKASSDTIKREEGCLSFPGLGVDIERPCEVEVEFQDETGKKHKNKYDGLMGRCIQHEIDHLNGVVFIDHLSKLKKDLAVKKFAKILRKWEEE